MGTPNAAVVVLDNEDDRVPAEDEVREYAEFLGIDVDKEPHLLYIAREGVAAPVPPPWKVCTENAEDVFYFNFETGESVWDHPCDAKFRQMVEDARSGKIRASGPSAEHEGEPTSSSSIESGMSSKLEASCNSQLLSQEAHGGGGGPSKGSGGVEVVRNEVSDDESLSSDDGPRRPHSPRSVGSSDSDSEEAVEMSSPDRLGDSSKSDRGVHLGDQFSGAGATPKKAEVAAPVQQHQGLLETSGADVIVDLASEGAAPQDRIGSAHVEPNAEDELDTSDNEFRKAAMQGWRTIVGGLLEGRGGPEAKGIKTPGTVPYVGASAASRPSADPSHKTDRLHVAIVSARGVRNADWLLTGKSDPYCTCEIVGKKGSQIRTKVVANNLNPVWDYEAEVTGFEPGNVLLFQVYDDDIGRDEILGRAMLPSDQFFPAGFAGELPLSEAGKECSAFLRLRVQVAKPAAEAATGVASHTDTIDEEPFQKPSQEPQSALEAELECLSRCLVMLRDIRENQRKYLYLLQGKTCP